MIYCLTLGTWTGECREYEGFLGNGTLVMVRLPILLRAFSHLDGLRRSAPVNDIFFQLSVNEPRTFPLLVRRVYPDLSGGGSAHDFAF